jgi:hypothetical protein
MFDNVRIQLPLGPNENFIFAFSRNFRENFRENTNIFANISIRKLTLQAETLLILNTWGMGHQIEYCLLK